MKRKMKILKKSEKNIIIIYFYFFDIFDKFDIFVDILRHLYNSNENNLKVSKCYVLPSQALHRTTKIIP